MNRQNWLTAKTMTWRTYSLSYDNNWKISINIPSNLVTWKHFFTTWNILSMENTNES